MVRVASSFGTSGENGADVNGDGIVNILDLVRVAGAFGNAAAAPSADPRALAMLTAKDVGEWLAQAQGLDLTDATSRSFLGASSGSADPERDHAFTELSESIQPGDVDTVPVGGGCFRDADYLRQ